MYKEKNIGGICVKYFCLKIMEVGFECNDSRSRSKGRRVGGWVGVGGGNEDRKFILNLGLIFWCGRILSYIFISPADFLHPNYQSIFTTRDMSLEDIARLPVSCMLLAYLLALLLSIVCLCLNILTIVML